MPSVAATFLPRPLRPSQVLLQRIAEIGSTSQSVIRSKTSNRHQFNWATKLDGERYVFMAVRRSPQFGDVESGVEILFKHVRPGDVGLGFGTTGLGHAQAVKVFSAAMTFTRHILREVEPEALLFTATRKRQRLYARFAQMLVRRIPGATLRTYHDPSGLGYKITIPNEYYQIVQFP